MTLSRKTTAALRRYGLPVCLEAFFRHQIDGEGASSIAFALELTTRQADAAIDAGRDYMRDQHRIEVEALTCSVDFRAYVRANRLPPDTWQTQAQGTREAEYQIYLTCADDGKGGDVTRNGAPLLTFDQWVAA